MARGIKNEAEHNYNVYSSDGEEEKRAKVLGSGIRRETQSRKRRDQQKIWFEEIVG